MLPELHPQFVLPPRQGRGGREIGSEGRGHCWSLVKLSLLLRGYDQACGALQVLVPKLRKTIFRLAGPNPWPSNVTTIARPSLSGSAAGTRHALLRRVTTLRCPNITSWRCFHIPPAASTWATCATMRWAMLSLAICGLAATMCCTPWAGTPLACRLRTPPWRKAHIPKPGPMKTLQPCGASSSPWGCRLIGAARSPRAIHPTTGMNRKCSSTS